MKNRHLLGILVAVLAAACAADSPPRVRLGDGTSPFIPIADVQQIMAHVLDPAADVYWESVGWIVDYEGTHEIEPRSDEEWQAVLNAAYIVAESGNLLMMEGRAVPGPWTAMAQNLVDAGRQAVRAAEAKDKFAVFDAGAEVYFTCNACHAVYLVGNLRPNIPTD